MCTSPIAMVKMHGDLPPGRGVVDFRPYLAQLKKVGI